MRPPIFLFGLARKERQRRARWKKEKGAARDRQLSFRYSVRATAQPGCELYSSGKPVYSCFRGWLRLRSRRCLSRKRRFGTAICLRSPGESKEGPQPLFVSFQNREILKRARRVKQTCRGHVCSQSGEQTCLRPGQEKSKSSPPLWRFFCNFSLSKQRKVAYPACAYTSAGTNQ